MAHGEQHPNEGGTVPQHARRPSGAPWRLVRYDGALGATRRVIRQIQQHAARTRDEGDLRPLVITPGPRWVLEPHAEPALTRVLDVDPGADGVVGWWRWADHAAEAGEPSPAVVRVGGVGETGGDDVRTVDLLVRPMSIGLIVIRATALERIGSLELDRTGEPGVIPADAILDAASTWVLATALVCAGGRLASLPRTCSERRRTITEDPERLTSLGRAWLIQTAMRWMQGRVHSSGLGIDVGRDLLDRWQRAPLTPLAPSEADRDGGSGAGP